MKKLIFLLLFVSITVLSYGQRKDGEWILGIGVNTVNSLGTQSPFNSPGDWAFKQPIAISIEHSWTKLFSIEQSFSLNGFSESDVIDGVVLTDDKTFFSANTKIKYYFDDLLFDASWLDLNVNAGVGIFNVDELNTSANLGFGATFWVSDTIGIAFKSLAKFALNHKSRYINNNHFQHFLELTIKL